MKNSLQRVSQGQKGNLSQSEFSRVRELLDKRYADNTKVAYLADFKQFEIWIGERQGAALPCSPETLVAYVVHMEGTYKVSTVHRKVYAIGKAHIDAGFENPVLHKGVKEVLKGLRREKRSEGIKQAPALRLETIRPILKELHTSTTNKCLRDRALILLGFFGAFRRSELVGLKWEDLQQVENGYAVEVKHSKTDQEGEGMIKAIPFRSEIELCPIRALQALKENSSYEYVFTSITKGDKMRDKPLSSADVSRVVKRYFGEGFSAHSLRSGFITEASAKGSSHSQIMQQSGHKDVKTVQRYTRYTDVWEGNAVLNI